MSEVIETRVNHNELSEIESLCVNCEKNGVTRLLFCKIPFFGDVIVSSFECPHCFLKNSEIQQAADIQDHGKRFRLKVTKKEDLQRMTVTSTNCKVMIPHLDFEVPHVKKGTISTVEGLLQIFINDLKSQQPVRKIMQPEAYEKLEIFIKKLEACARADESVLPFYFILEDPAGNSFMENPNAPLKDVNLNVQEFKQTREHLIKMGYIAETEKDIEERKMKEAIEKMEKEEAKNPQKKKVFHYGDKEISDMISKMHNAEKLNMGHKVDKSMPLKIEDVKMDERLCIFKVDCYACFKESEMKSYQCEIPFFKEIIIMSFKCHHCGYKDTEVKIGGEISKMAKRITLSVTEEDDLNRDIFKSDTAEVKIKEFNFEMMPGSLGSFYTTVEGLLGLIADRLEKSNPFKGDSSEVHTLKVLTDFIENNF
jgi:zinc finger protein